MIANVSSSTISVGGPALLVAAGTVAEPSLEGDDMADGTCSIAGCGAPRKSREWCGAHYGRWRRHGDPNVITRAPRNSLTVCRMENCDRKAQARHLCKMHWHRWKVHGDPSINLDERTPEERLWAQTVRRGPDDCWEWTGSNVRGYGRFTTQKGGVRTIYRTHRYSYELHNGPIPDGLWVLHHCDNPPCVNPRHLYLGTNTENVRDRMERGRQKKPGAVLTPDQVRQIRQLRAAGMSQRQTARLFGVGRGAIVGIDRGITWRDVA